MKRIGFILVMLIVSSVMVGQEYDEYGYPKPKEVETSHVKTNSIFSDFYVAKMELSCHIEEQSQILAQTLFKESGMSFTYKVVDFLESHPSYIFKSYKKTYDNFNKDIDSVISRVYGSIFDKYGKRKILKEVNFKFKKKDDFLAHIKSRAWKCYRKIAVSEASKLSTEEEYGKTENTLTSIFNDRYDDLNFLEDHSFDYLKKQSSSYWNGYGYYFPRWRYYRY